MHLTSGVLHHRTGVGLSHSGVNKEDKMKGKKKGQALDYLKEKKVKDLKDELLIMKLSYFLSIPKVRVGILIAIDVIFFFLAQYVTNVLKDTLFNFRSLLSGENTDSAFSLLQLFDFRHSGIWYLIVILTLIVIDVRIYFGIYTNYRDINRNQKGSIRWSTLDEIREQYPAVPLKFAYPYETYYGKGGIPVCQYGTHYENINGELILKDIDKGIIFIDRTPVNNLIIGITRSGKGETYVFVVIDMYSRAENKEYYMYYEFEENGIYNFRKYATNIFYDYREGGIEKHDIPELIDERKLNFGKKEFIQVLNNYEMENNVKLQLPEGVTLEENYNFFDYIDIDKEKNVVTELRPVSYMSKMKPKKNRDDKIELKLLAKTICITDKVTGEILEYAFDPKDGQSKKDALDKAFLHLGMLKHPFEQKYDEYRDAMGFELQTISYKVNKTEDINFANSLLQIKNITSENNEFLSKSNAYDDIEIEEEPLDGVIEPEKEKMDYLKLLGEVAELNKIPFSQNENEASFHFRRNYQASMIVGDPKLELFIASKPILELRGYEVYCINLINPYESSGYNPLQLITDTYKNGDPAEASAIARSLATSIFAGEVGNGDNAFFYDNASFLTAALIMSEVIDELRADEEANKLYLQEHIEATERFKKLPDDQKKEICQKGKQLEKIKQNRYVEKDKFQLVLLDREIDALEKELSPYNYKLEEFKPRNDHEKKINLPNVLLKFTSLAEKTLPPEVEGAEPRNALDVFFQNRDILDVARNLYSAVKIAGGEKVKGSIYSTVLSKLTGFMDDKIKKMTACSSFQLEDIGFGERPVAIFMALPDYDNSNVFIQSIFVSQVYYALAKRATNSGGKCKREVIFLLDEFGNIPAISNMASMITVCLGRNIRFNLIVQAYSQIEKEYGEHDSNTIYGNCGNQIYIQTNNNDTAKQFSELIGKETITNVTRMGGEFALFTQKQYTESTEEKPLLDPNELMEFVEGECVVKRVMMRKDQYNNKVKPRPILNRNENAFPLRYQYMGEWYNTENQWDNLHAESCAQLDLSLYVSDFDKMLKDIEFTLTDEYQAWYELTTENYAKNRLYPIGDFVNKQDIEKKLITQVGELRDMSKDKLYQLTIADIEKYYIRYEANLPAFRQRMYEVSDWSRVEDKTVRCYGNELIRYFQLALGENVAEVWDMYEFDDEEILMNTTTEELIDILEEYEVPEKNILQFKNALEKYEKEEISV